MKNYFTLLFVSIFAFVLTGCSAHQDSPKDVVQKFMTAIVNEDAGALQECLYTKLSKEDLDDYMSSKKQTLESMSVDWEIDESKIELSHTGFSSVDMYDGQVVTSVDIIIGYVDVLEKDNEWYVARTTRW